MVAVNYFLDDPHDFRYAYLWFNFAHICSIFNGFSFFHPHFGWW